MSKDVWCDKLDMFYICELQIVSAELVHDVNVWWIHEKALNWKGAKKKVFNMELEHGTEGEAEARNHNGIIIQM